MTFQPTYVLEVKMFHILFYEYPEAGIFQHIRNENERKLQMYENGIATFQRFQQLVF